MAIKLASSLLALNIPSNKILKTDANGNITEAVAGTDYLVTVPSHTHDASNITSGTFSTSRIPNLAASKITSGTFANARISSSSVTQHEADLTIHTLSGSTNDVITINSTLQVDQGSEDAIISFEQGGVEIGKFDQDGYLYATGFKSSGTTGFLKSDGSIDTSTYASSSHNHNSLYVAIAGGYYDSDFAWDGTHDFMNEIKVSGASATTTNTTALFYGTGGLVEKRTLGTAAFSATSAFATAAQGALADSALQSLPSHTHDTRYYTKTQSDTRYLTKGDNFIPISMTASDYEASAEEVVLGAAGSYRGLAFPNGAKDFEFEVSIKGGTGANHQGIFWGATSIASIIGAGLTGYKTTHQNADNLHIRDIANNSNQMTINPGFAPDDGQYHRYRLVQYRNPDTSNAILKVYLDGNLIFDTSHGGYNNPPQTPTYFGFIVFTGDVKYAHWNVRDITDSEDLIRTIGEDVFQPVGNYLTSLPAHHHDARYYTETEMDDFFDGTTAKTGYNKTNWDTAYGWGNHADENYLTSYTETDTLATVVARGQSTAQALVVTAVDSGNPAAAANSARLSGYGILGNRGTFYLTNGGGVVQIGKGASHNDDPVATFGNSIVHHHETVLENYLNVEASTGIRSDGWVHLNRYATNLNVSVGNNGSNVNLLVPNGNIETQQNIKSRGYLLFDNDGNFSGGNYYTMEDHVDGYFRMGYAFNSNLVISTAGNIGIGTTAPTKRLHIRHDGNAPTGLLIQNLLDNNGTNDGDAAAEVFLNAASNNAYFRVHGAPTDSAAEHEVEFGTTAGSSFFTFKPSGNERMRITNGGNVGIGTTNPTKKLHVDSDGNEVAFFKGNSGGAWIDIQSSTSNLWSIGAVDANKMGIYNRTNATYPLVVENGGEIGIGTTTPGHTLDVNGTVRASSYLVTPLIYSGGGNISFGNDVEVNAEFNIKGGEVFRMYRSGGNAHQRADARVDGSDQARIHWYGKNDANGTANFKHAWYDGANYINVTASNPGRVTFSGSAQEIYIGSNKVATETFASGEAQAVQDNLDGLAGSLGSLALEDSVTISEVTGLQTALDGKLSTSGGTLTGDLNLHTLNQKLSFSNTAGQVSYISHHDSIGQLTLASDNIISLRETDSNVVRHTFTTNDGNYTATGVITASGGNSGQWNTAYSQRNRWDGGSAGLNAATGRASLGLGSAATSENSDFALASHTHSYLPLSGGTLTGDLVMQDEAINFKSGGSSTLPQFFGHRSTTDLNSRWWTSEGGWAYTTFEAASTNAPSGATNNANGLLTFNTHVGDYGHQLAFTNTGTIYNRSRNGGSFSSWKSIATGDELQQLEDYVDTNFLQSIPDNISVTSITVGGTRVDASTDRPGLLEIERNGTNSYAGIMTRFSGTAEWALMGDETQFGLYDDEHNEWAWRYVENGRFEASYNGGVKFQTTSTGTKSIGHFQIAGTTQKLELGEFQNTSGSGRTVLIEGKAGTTNGEGSGRIFFSENNTTAGNAYGLSLYYEGDGNAVLPSGFNPNTGNATWSLRVHNASVNGTPVISGSRTNNDVYFGGNLFVPNVMYHTGDTNTYMQFHAADQWRVVTGGAERLEVNNTNTTVQNKLIAANHIQFGGSNQGYTTSGGTYGAELHKIKRITLTSGNSNWDGDNHSITSRNIAGADTDSISINSYNDITLRLDSNNNNATSHFYITDNTLTGTSSMMLDMNTASNETLIRTSVVPYTDRQVDLGRDSNRWRIIFCEVLDSAGLHEKNLQNPEGEKSVGDYATGTVLVWKGGKNVPCTEPADHMRMGIAVKGIDSPLIQGAEPVLVTGSVNEGDYLVTSSVEGHAAAISPQYMRQHGLYDCVLGKALEGGNGDSHIIKTWVNI